MVQPTVTIHLTEAQARAVLGLIADVEYGSPTLAGAKKALKTGLATQAGTLALTNPVTGPAVIPFTTGGARAL